MLLFPFSGASLLDPKEKPGSGNAHCVTQAKEDVHGRRFVVVLQLADVGAVNLSRKRKLFLRQSGFLACLANFLAE